MDDNKFDDFFEAKEDELLDNNNTNMNNTFNSNNQPSHMPNNMDINNTPRHMPNNIPNNNQPRNMNNAVNHHMNSQPKEPKKKINKKLIIIIAAVVVALIALFVVFKVFFNKSSTFNGYTANVGETLKVREVGGNFDLKVTSSLEKFHSDSEFLYRGDFLKLQVQLDNKENEELSLALVTFAIVDDSKNELATDCTIFSPFSEKVFDLKIPKNGSGTGYIYFEDKKDSNNIRYVNQYTIYNAKYLKVSVTAWVDKKAYEQGIISTKSEYYYIAIR